MSQVQNPLLHNVVQPVLFMGTGLLAGRFIQYFPEASKGGLFLTAGLGTSIALVSQKWAPDNEEAKYSLMRTVTSLALGALLAPLVSKALKGRVEINFSAAGRLFLLETIVAGGMATISNHIASGPNAELIAMHAQYNKDSETWEKLTLKERVEFINKCFDANLPPFSFTDPEKKILFRLLGHLEHKDFSSLKDKQLLWCGGVVRYAGFQSYQKIEDLFTALHSKQLPMKGNGRSSRAMCNPDIPKEVRKAYFVENPLGYFINAMSLQDLFEPDNAPNPTTYDVNQIRELSVNELQEYYSAYYVQSSPIQKALPPEIGVVLFGEFYKKTPFAPDDVPGHAISPITQRVIDILKEDENALNWFYNKYLNSKELRDACDIDTEESLREQLNELLNSKAK